MADALNQDPVQAQPVVGAAVNPNPVQAQPVVGAAMNPNPVQAQPVVGAAVVVGAYPPIFVSFENFRLAVVEANPPVPTPLKGTDFLSQHGVGFPVRSAVLGSLDPTTAKVVKADCRAATPSQLFYFYRATKNLHDFLMMYHAYSQRNRGIYGLLLKFKVRCGIRRIRDLMDDTSQTLLIHCETLSKKKRVELYTALIKEVGLIGVVRGRVDSPAASIAHQLCSLGVTVLFTAVGADTSLLQQRLRDELHRSTRLSLCPPIPSGVDFFVDTDGSGAGQLGDIIPGMLSGAVVVDASASQALFQGAHGLGSRVRLIPAPPAGLTTYEEEAEAVVRHIFSPMT